MWFKSIKYGINSKIKSKIYLHMLNYKKNKKKNMSYYQFKKSMIMKQNLKNLRNPLVF